nr:MAG TPA: hypothetical protein [Caudoviricetes sp.]DAP38611.1 MAG TPA: hypothetical protein [Caudoviricetes sp.]
MWAQRHGLDCGRDLCELKYHMWGCGKCNNSERIERYDH